MGAIFIDRVNNYHILSGYPKDEYHIDISNPCVSGDTLLLTDKGYAPIDSLVNTPVNIWNGYRWSRVIPKITGRNQEMMKVSFSNGMTLRCTKYHKFLMPDNSRVEAQDLQVGDKLQKWNYPVINGIERLDDPYTRGFYCGDGTRDKMEIVLYGDKINLKPYLHFHHENTRHADKQKIVLLKQYDKDFVPYTNFSIFDKVQWFAGLVDADGCKNDNEGGISVTSVNHNFLKRTKFMLDTLGVKSSIGLAREGGVRELPANDGTGDTKAYYCQSTYRLTIGVSDVNTLCKLGFYTHRVELPNIVGRDNCHFVSVVSVRPDGVADLVYCVNEPFNHTVVFNGIMTGNCAEFYGNKFNSCNLGSINLYNCIKNPFTPVAELDRNKLDSLVRLGVRALNEVLDYGYDSQPLEENRECINDWRSIGLGVFGLADALVAMGLRYGSEESIAFIHLIGSCLKNGALRASSDYALERGTFNMYDEDWIYKSKYIKHAPDGVKEMIHLNGLANGTLLSIAPTGTISTMCGHTGGVEPIYQVAYERTTHTLQNEGNGQTFKIYAKSVWDLLKHDGIDPDSVSIDEIKAKYPYVVDTYDIDPIDRVRVQATLQEYVDNAISSTINMKHDSTVEDVENVYLEAWKQGCKGITIFRDGCERFSILGKDKPEKSVETKPETVEKVADETKLDCLEPHKRGNIHSLWGKTFVYKTACVRKFYVTVNCMDNDIFEVFVGADTGCQANINTITRLTSYALRLGGKVDDIIKELNSAICPACSHLIRNGNKEYNKSCASCIADALKEMQSILWSKGKAEGHMMFLDHLSEKIVETITPEPLSEVNLDTTKHNDMFECPECHQKTLKPEGKCATCSNCGYSKCG